METKECTRCGVCCISFGTCSLGEENVITGHCYHLQINEDLSTTCLLLEKDPSLAEELGIGKGCIPKHLSDYDHRLCEVDYFKRGVILRNKYK